MIEFDALKKNWQNQKSAADMKPDFDNAVSSSLSKLKKFEKRILKINIAKTTGIILIVFLFIWSMLFASPVSILKIIAVAMLVISIVIFWTKYLRIQLRTTKLNVNENSLDFIDDVLENFSAQRELFKKDFRLFGAVLIIIINILYLDLLNGMQLLERVGFHIFMSAALLAVLFVGIKFRMRRFKKENEPIENELIKMKEDLENIK